MQFFAYKKNIAPGFLSDSDATNIVGIEKKNAYFVYE